MPHDEKETAPISRRRFLRLGLGLPLLGAAIALPVDLWAADVSGGFVGGVPVRKPQPPRMLMIDPGHGGRDPGAIGLRGTHEKDVTLDVAKRMADALAGRPGVTVRLTRDEDVFLPLEER